MTPSPEQTLRDYKKASAKIMQEIGGDTQKAIAYLVKIGILEKHQSSEHGVRLVKDLRLQG